VACNGWRDRIVHRWLRIPYRLSVRYKRLRRPFTTTYVLIHGLADTGALWQPLLAQLPKQSNYIVVDLLGHGESPQPHDESIYRASEQARHVLATCVATGLSGPVVLIGHSFGALVATEFSHMYRGIVRRAVLVSPPIYRDETGNRRDWLRQDKLLRSVYRQVLKTPDLVVAGYELGDRLGALGFSRTQLSKSTFTGFENTLRAGIISQRTGQLLRHITIPTTIIYGRLDPLLVARNFTALAQVNSCITVRPLSTGHAIRGRTLREIMTVIQSC